MTAPTWIEILILALLAGILLDFPWLIYFSIATGLILGLSHQWRKHAADKIHYTRRFHYTRGFPGESNTVRVTVENNKLLPLSWLRISDPWPLAIGPEDSDTLAPSHLPDQGLLVNLYSLRWYERITRTYPLLLRKRGMYQVGPLSIETGDLFGLYEDRREIENTDLMVVFPEVLPMERLKLPAEDPFGDRHAFRPLFEDPTRTVGIRPYHPEDSFRRIHWPATARTGAMQVKVFEPVTARTMVLCMNVSTEVHFWLGYSPAILEQLIKVCATLAYYGMEDGYAVGLFSNSCQAHSDQPFRIPPGRSPNQLAVLLQALAGATPYVTVPFENFLIRSMAEIPFGSTLVIITALITEALEDTLIRLRRYRPHITLISLAVEPPPDLPGIRTIHLPFREEVEAAA